MPETYFPNEPPFARTAAPRAIRRSSYMPGHGKCCQPQRKKVVEWAFLALAGGRGGCGLWKAAQPRLSRPGQGSVATPVPVRGFDQAWDGIPDSNFSGDPPFASAAGRPQAPLSGMRPCAVEERGRPRPLDREFPGTIAVGAEIERTRWVRADEGIRAPGEPSDGAGCSSGLCGPGSLWTGRRRRGRVRSR